MPPQRAESIFSGNCASYFALAHVIREIETDYGAVIIDTKGNDGRGEVKEAAMLVGDIVSAPTC